MSVTTAPPAPPKKRGLGCLGCGCLILGLLAALVLGLVAALGVILYSQMAALTSTVPTAVPSFDGGDEMYNSARQKIVAFDHDLHNHEGATLQLSADEINTLIARDPRFSKSKILLYVTLTDNEVGLQTSVPTRLMLHGLFPKPYLNGSTSFGLDFDPDAKSLNLTLHNLQIGQKVMPQNVLPIIQTELIPALNQELQGDPEFKLLFEQAKSIEIQNNQLVVEI